MEAGEWELEFTEARERLCESNDFQRLRNRGHNLRNGVVLTSVSDLPFEMSLKCIHCGIAFWFENATWSTGGVAQWQISSISLEQASVPCQALG
jgi:hypothetical protein